MPYQIYNTEILGSKYKTLAVTLSFVSTEAYAANSIDILRLSTQKPLFLSFFLLQYMLKGLEN
jgi:hypothetical protein